MEFTAIKGAATVVTAIGVIGTGAYTLDERHAPRSQVQKMEAGQHVQAIQGWIQAARQEGPSAYVCDAIVQELIELCSEAPNHYLCSEKGQQDTLARAGCL